MESKRDQKSKECQDKWGTVFFPETIVRVKGQTRLSLGTCFLIIEMCIVCKFRTQATQRLFLRILKSSQMNMMSGDATPKGTLP